MAGEFLDHHDISAGIEEIADERGAKIVRREGLDASLPCPFGTVSAI